MKKALSLFLILLFIFSFIPAFASDDMEQILISLKKRIPSTEKYEEFNSRVNQYNNKTFYAFEWYSNADGKFSSMNVTVSDSGIITSFSRYDSSTESENKININRPSYAEALLKAKELSKSLNPSIADKLLIEKASQSENIFDTSYRFKITRMENGIPVLHDNGYIPLDSAAEKIISYSVNYTENIEFPSSDGIIDKSTAIDAYKEKLGLELRYFFVYDNNIKQAYPAYVPSESSDTYINALTGEVVEITYTPEANKEMINGSGSLTMGTINDSALTKPETEELERISGLLSEEKLLEIIKSNKYIAPEKGMSKESFSLNKAPYEKDGYYVSFDFSSKEDNFRYASYTINAKSGEIINYRLNKDIPYDAKEKISEEKAYSDADIAVSYLAGEKYGEFKETKSENFSKSYQRMVNGIPTEDYISIGYDKFSGKINRYSISYSGIDFPDISEIASPEEIANSMFSQIEYFPCYIINGSGSEIVYIMKAPVAIKLNPFHGKLLDYNGEEYEWKMPFIYNDIKGHWAEKYISQLASYRIGFNEESFRPDDEITKSDYISLLSAIMISYEPIMLKTGRDNSVEISMAVRRGITDGKEDLTKNLTRADGAVYMIRALGIDEYASMNIYKKPYPDVEKNAGHIAILSAMGVFKGDSAGNFNPDKPLTRAEALVTIYNYLLN